MKSILLIKMFLGLVEMTFGLVYGQLHHHGRYIQTQFYTFKLLLIIYENDFLQLIFNICVYKHWLVE